MALNGADNTSASPPPIATPFFAYNTNNFGTPWQQRSDNKQPPIAQAWLSWFNALQANSAGSGEDNAVTIDGTAVNYPASAQTAQQTTSDFKGDHLSIHMFVSPTVTGAGINIADGGSHPVSSAYAGLAAAQADYPHVRSVDDELFWSAAQAGLLFLQSQGGGGLAIPDGNYVSNRSLVVYADTTLRIGAGTITAPDSVPLIRCWDQTGPYAGITIEGQRGATILQVPSTATPGSTLVYTVSGGNTLNTSSPHPFLNGDPVYVQSGGTAPSPLATQTTYWVINAATSTLQLAATPGGSAIALSGGSGTQYLASRCSTIELTSIDTSVTPNGADTAGFSLRARVANLILDGGKPGVAAPVLAQGDDTSHSGIMSQATRYAVIENVEARNWWFDGFSFGLCCQFSHFVNPRTAGCGYSFSIGYCGLALQGSSWHNVIVNHTSDGDIQGVEIDQNAWFNVYSGTIRNCYHGLVINVASGNAVYANDFTITIENSTSQALSVAGNARNNTIRALIDVVNNESGVYIGSGVYGNHFQMIVRRANLHGVRLAGGPNRMDLVLIENSQLSVGGYYGLNCEGATNNEIRALFIDEQMTPGQRCIGFDAASTGNNYHAHITYGTISNVSDVGTDNSGVAQRTNSWQYWQSFNATNPVLQGDDAGNVMLFGALGINASPITPGFSLYVNGFAGITVAFLVGTPATAPLVLSASSLVTIPTNGGIEYDGNNLYYTDSTGTRRQVSQQTGAVASVFGRTGTVTAQTGDYSASQVSGLAASATTDTTDASNITSGSMSTARISGLAASATTDTTDASNISSGTLPDARLTALFGGNQTLALSSVNTITFDTHGRYVSHT